MKSVEIAASLENAGIVRYSYNENPDVPPTFGHQAGIASTYNHPGVGIVKVSGLQLDSTLKEVKVMIDQIISKMAPNLSRDTTKMLRSGLDEATLSFDEIERMSRNYVENNDESIVNVIQDYLNEGMKSFIARIDKQMGSNGYTVMIREGANFIPTQ